MRIDHIQRHRYNQSFSMDEGLDKDVLSVLHK